MLDKIFNINTYNIIEDDNNYYFFRALNNGDLDDYNNKIITDDNNKIKLIRTDLERYKETPKYNNNNKLSLEELIDHIKPNHRYDTNCISLSTNANVTSLYGREYYQDKYILIKISKDNLNKEVIDAGLYLLKEVDRLLPKEITIKKELSTNYINKEAIYFNILNDNQLKEKNKIISKINNLEKELIKDIPNNILIETINNAFLSLEFIHYKNINNNIIEISSSLIDVFSLIQQLPMTDKERNIFTKELLNNINNKEINNNNNNIDYNIDTNNKLYYIARSKLRIINSINILNKLTNNKYNNYLLNMKNNLYGVEPYIFSKENTNKYKVNNYVYLNISSNEKELLDEINNYNQKELKRIIDSKRKT